MWWRRLNPRALRAGAWYVLGAASLTLVWLAAVVLAPDTGLTRSYWYPDDGSAQPVVAERITAVDPAFIDEQDLSTRDYRVRWEGVWFSPRAERVDFLAGADDGVILRVDGETVLERNPALGMSTAALTVDLEAGAHRLEIEHWQAGGGRALNVQWAPAGGTPAPLGSTRLFPEDPGAAGYWLRFAATRLPALVLLVWAAGLAALAALAVWRTIYRRVATLSREEVRRRLRTALLPAALGPSQLLLFGPWTVHDTNRNEFLVGFWELAPGWVWLLGPVVGALAALGLLLPARWFARYVAGLCAVGVLLWAQGNLLLADYGLLDGGGLDLASHDWRTPYEAALWMGILGLAVIFASVVTRAAPVAGGVLIVLQAFVLVVPMGREIAAPGMTGGRSDAAESAWRLPPPELYELSSTRNVIHIVLDGFPSHTFASILDADRLAFDRHWSGFTFFANHLGSHANTYLSMPSMLRGVAFGNEMPFRDYLDQHPTVFDVLGQEGYRLRSLAPAGHNHLDPSFPGVDAIRYDIPSPYGSYRNYVDAAAARLLDLSLFRHAPYAFKPGVYDDGRWFLQHRIERSAGPEATAAPPFGDAAFLRELATQVTVGDAAPVYMLLHVTTPHVPVVTDADCAYTPKTSAGPEDFSNQARCALRSVQTLLQRLRDLDLYDHSAIIVTSDHGSDLALLRPEDEHPLGGIRSPAGLTLARIGAYATPLLLMKPLAASGPLRTSHAPTSIADVPATLIDLAELPATLRGGVSVLRIDPAAPRQRTYAHHQRRRGRPRRFLDHLYAFSINGHIDDPHAWTYQGTRFGPADDRVAQRREHHVGLVAVQDETASAPDAHVYRTDGYAVFYAAPEKPRVTFDVRRMPAMADTQKVLVRIDGAVVDQLELADDAWRTLSYPVEARSADSPFCIELLTSPVWHDPTGESWGLMLRGEI